MYKSDEEIEDMLSMKTIYVYHNSSGHRKTMINDRAKEISYSYSINNIYNGYS